MTTAENSPKGSIFTVALRDILQNNFNLKLNTLEQRLRNKVKKVAKNISDEIKKSSSTIL